MRNINFAIFDELYFCNTLCVEDNPENFNLARAIRSCFNGTVLDIGCGRGWLVKHLNECGMEAYGLDFSDYAIENSVAPGRVFKGKAATFNQQFPFQFDIIILRDVCQCLELKELVDLFTLLQVSGKFIIFADSIKQPQEVFALGRPFEWYKDFFQSFDWISGRLNEIFQQLSRLDVHIFERTESIYERSEESQFLDPWLTHHDNTAVMAVILETSASRLENWKSTYDLHLSCGKHYVELREGNSRVEREMLGITRAAADYSLLADDTVIVDDRWIYTALAAFSDPQVGAVISPVQWRGEFTEQPDQNFWSTWPIMFRTLAYQQSQGQLEKFEELGWNVQTISFPLIADRLPKRQFEEIKPLTILTAFDDSKANLVQIYFEALLSIKFPHDRLRLVFFDDSRTTSTIYQELATFVRTYGSRFDSVTIRKARTNDYWLNMPDEEFYRWKGVRYPISALMAGLYNRMIGCVTTDQFLVWESDTIPINPDFLQVLQSQLHPSDGAISGHYICRKEKKSLAWKITSIIPFVWEWIEPQQGVEVIDAIPHGLTLFNSWTLSHFRFNVLANDPRDFRGPDLIMGRQFKFLGIPIKIHWDIQARHFNSDGTYLQP